jgi:hypothetical protein
MVLPVRDIDPAIIVAGDVTDEVELAGGGSRLAPGEQYLWTRAFWYPSET